MMKVVSVVFIFCVFLSACSIGKEEKPVGVGFGTDSFSKSPCACSPAFFDSGKWVG
jgi:hypothetical protein